MASKQSAQPYVIFQMKKKSQEPEAKSPQTIHKESLLKIKVYQLEGCLLWRTTDTRILYFIYYILVYNILYIIQYYIIIRALVF